MRRTKMKVNKRKCVIFILAAVFCTVIFFTIRSIENKIEPKIKDICTYYCKMQLAQILNDSVEETIASNFIEYSDLAVRIMDGNKISAVEVRTENVNKIQSQIVRKVHKKLEEKSKSEISIPIGTVSDSYLLSGKGPKVKIKFLPEGSVNTALKSDFSSAGINQTCHKISIDINAEAVVILPSESFTVSVKSECMLAESLIIGDVPEGIISSS